MLPPTNETPIDARVFFLAMSALDDTTLVQPMSALTSVTETTIFG